MFKVHSRCDLACDHCYVYTHADQTWRDRPPAMAKQTVRAAAVRIAEHATAHGLDRIRLVLHGGEPLLLGAARLRAILAHLQQVIGAVAHLELGMQTNGVRLTTEICDLMVEYGVRIGVSMDGDASANDRHRRFATGAGSHHLVLRALKLLRQPQYRQIYGGLLCTLDIANDPLTVYQALLEQEPPRVDLLLPHATWDTPPPRPTGRATPYADWLGIIYDRWRDDGYPMAIRLFDSLRSLATGGLTATEAIGLAPVDLLVVETDGAWEQVDSLKTAYHGAAGTGFTVFTHSVDEVMGQTGLPVRQGNLAELCDTCRRCPVVRQCGGGLYAHRYRSGSGFDNPSVYCADLKALIVATEPKAVDPPRPGKRIAMTPPGLIENLAGGYGDADVMAFLASTQLGITRTLVAEVVSQALRADSEAADSVAEAGWDALANLEVTAPDAVALVLKHPYIRSWAVECLRESNPAAARAWHRAHLACLAAAAAIHGWARMTITTPVYDGWVILPTLGRVAVPDAATRFVEIHTEEGRFTVQSAGGWVVKVDEVGEESERWQPVRRVDLAGQVVAVEDTDPYRDCYRKPLAPRGSAEDARVWYRMMQEAFAHIEREVPDQVASFRATLHSVVPLLPGPAGAWSSATARHAFGSVAVAQARTPDVLAVLFVHEIQHLKLSALLDLCDLVDTTHPALMSVKWKPEELRPPEAVLQGAYAHLAIADVWRARLRLRPDDLAATAGFELYRGWVEDAMDSLLSSGALTPAGRVFVDRMDWTVRSWHGGN